MDGYRPSNLSSNFQINFLKTNVRFLAVATCFWCTHANLQFAEQFFYYPLSS